MNLNNKSRRENEKLKINHESTKSPTYKYHIVTDDNCLIKLKNNYGTNDIELKTLVDLINEKEEAWELVSNSSTCKILRKFDLESDIPYSKTIAHIKGYTSKQIFEVISIISERLKWDVSFKEFISVEQNLNEGWETFYMILKV
jgi:hypothetical protein